MKIFTPSHAREISTGIFALLLTVGISIFAILRLISAELSPWLLLWIMLPLIGLPLSSVFVYRLFGLITAQYALDRNGFYLKWGLAEEHIPLARIRSITRLDRLPECAGGQAAILGLARSFVNPENGQELEFFTAGSPKNTLLLTSESRMLVFTPADPVRFLKTYRDFTHQGALQRIKPLSIRPVFLATALFKDRLARWLLPSGLVINLLLLAFLILGSSALPENVPFSFDTAGRVQLLAPANRLLLLPLAGGLLWMLNFLLGTWFYHRKADPILSYVLWGAAVVPGLLLWGAVINLLSTAAG
ncbi:MAG: hypothetical protein JXA25_12570 [Anaerolineales bacterium]|nr:hypothetical protein [Anaerolineales bacterium]